MLNHTHVASRPPTDQASIAATWRPTAPISSKKQPSCKPHDATLR